MMDSNKINLFYIGTSEIDLKKLKDKIAELFFI